MITAFVRAAAVLLLVLCARPALAQSIAGEWDWGAGAGIVVVSGDGTGRDSRGNPLAWTVVDADSRTFELRWSHGFTDRATLSADGNGLEIVNNLGSRFVATRRGPARSDAAGLAERLAGRWKWGVGAGIVEILAGGTGRDGRGNTMTWKVRDAAIPSFELRWSNGYTDLAILSADGRRLDLTNNAGTRFGAERIGAAAAAPVDLNGSWSGGLVHVWQDGTSLLVTATWKRQDGKWVSWRGEGALSGNVAEIEIRYSPMPHGPVAPWHGRLTVSPDGDTIEALYTQGGTTDRRSYRRDP